QVVRMPEDLAGWDHALETGEANIHEMAAPPDDDGERADSIPTDALPLAVINGAERFPVTTSDGIGTEGELVTVTWPGKVAFPGGRGQDRSPGGQLRGERTRQWWVVGTQYPPPTTQNGSEATFSSGSDRACRGPRPRRRCRPPARA